MDEFGFMPKILMNGNIYSTIIIYSIANLVLSQV
jgi:hypothetical protein